MNDRYAIRSIIRPKFNMLCLGTERNMLIFFVFKMYVNRVKTCIYIYWITVEGRQTASTHRKNSVAWLPHKAVKSCPYIQFKTIYSTTLPYSSIKLWSEVLNAFTVFWLMTLSGKLFHSSNVFGK